VAALSLQPVFAEEEVEYTGAPDPKSYGYTVLGVGIATPFSLPWGWDWDVFGIDANLLYSDVNKMYGIEVGGIGNVARLDMYGIQAALAFNYANRNAVGIQAGLVNMCNRTSYGVTVDAVGVNREFIGLQADILGSITDDSLYGLSVAGLTSAVREDMWGWQIALGATFARRVHGFQTALFFNMTEELRGAQLGLVNYAGACSAGFQVGLVNLILDNQIPFLPIFNCYF
jgi:hypothetical protein